MHFKEQFEELKHSGLLPTPSSVGMKILVLTQQDDCSLDEITRVIQADPALTGRIIKLASSSQMTGASHVATAKDASVRLGTRTVSTVALGFTMISGNRSGKCEDFEYDAYWSWSLANAVAAEAISRETGIAIPAECFTCAILARIGQLALASVHPSDYADVLRKKRAMPQAHIIELEREAFRINHREVAAAMLEDWGLPQYFANAVLSFEEDNPVLHVDDAPTFDMIRVLHGASAIADVCVEDKDSQARHWPQLERICGELDIEQEQFGALFEKIVPEWKEWGQMLKVPTNGVMLLKDMREQSVGRKSRAASESNGLRILAVDDDPVSLKLLVRHLERAGHQVSTATNGKDALAVALDANPQIVVTDWMMPVMDGIELTKTLRRFNSGRNLYVLILTGRAEEDRVVEAFAAGVDDYIVKPFKPKLLLARIRGGQRVVRLQEQVEEDKKLQREQVAKLAVLNRRLKAAAMTDALTDLPNRRYAMKRLEMEWANCARSDTPFAVVMLDIDHFKQVNDTYGHDAGDVVLQATARAISRSLRAGDTCARMGGEEFLVICPNTDEESAWQVAERIRSVIEANVLDMPSFKGSVTASLGLASRYEGATIDGLLKLADEAVYAAKHGGRNRVSQGHPPEARESA